MRKIIILGPQGCGKGTQATRLATLFGLQKISMGQLLRDEVAAGTPMGKKIGNTVATGELVSDEIASEVLHQRLRQPDVMKGYILDGFPRDMKQYEAFEKFDSPTDVIVITLPREKSVMRLLDRAQKEGRADDTLEVINRRLEIYETDTQPVLNAYEERGILRTIDGDASIDDVADRIAKMLTSA
ncbi:adenylate kinase [Patescibacteria group bacterium]|nr:adenylate kinase [Patescibacteria group bacterium]